MMKVGFSSLACPAWDLETIVTQAKQMGYDGVELRGLQDELHLPLAPDLAGDAQAARRLFSENGVELVCLGASATLTSKRTRELAKEKAAIVEYLELAACLGCPAVRIYAGDVEPGDGAQACLARMAAALQSLVPVAARQGVILMVENGGDFAGSQPLWHLIDAVGHPNVRACWNQCHAMTLREPPTISIPRLRQKIGLVHVCDAKFDEFGVLLEYTALGQGHVQVAREVELLKGVIYHNYLIVDWPKRWVDSLAEPDKILPEAVKFLRAKIEEKQDPLTAYKGDKHAPRLAPLKNEPASA